MNAKRINRIQNLAIVLLTFSALFLFASLPLFGALSDQSLLELAHGRLQRDGGVSAESGSVPASLAFPVRMVYTNGFARLSTDALTTASGEFERSGTHLGEAIGSASGGTNISERVFLEALRGEGLYFDFTVPLPLDVLSDLLGIAPPDAGPSDVRRALLVPADSGDVTLYIQDGSDRQHRFSTAASSAALIAFLAVQSGSGAEFAFLLDGDFQRLSPYTLVLSEPAPRVPLRAVNALPAGEDGFLRRAGFNAHTDNRFTESSGTVIIRESSSALYLRPNGTVDYQGGEATPDSPYFVAAAEPGAPSRIEAASAAQALALALMQDYLGDAALYLSGISGDGGLYEVTFDLTADGTPIRFSDGSHAASFFVQGQSIAAFSIKARQYALGTEPVLLLPLTQAAAIARIWDDAELSVAYVDAGGEEVLPAWIAE